MKTTLDFKQWLSPDASRQIRRLTPVFKSLRSIHEDYINGETFHDRWTDCSFWYKERPQTGFLAAAVWRTGGTALEEYGAKKRSGQRKSEGRCDLWIRIHSPAGVLGFACEAKYTWQNLAQKSQRLAAKLFATLDRATADVRRVPGKRGLALCFATMAIQKQKRIEAAAHIDDVMKLLRADAKCDAWIWIGKAEGQKLPNWANFPCGLFVLLKEVG